MDQKEKNKKRKLSAMKTVGQILREKRENKDISTRAVADAIKVRERYIEAIEDDDYSAFASPVYLKGFLKNYAKFLDVPAEHIIAVYRRDTEEQKSLGGAGALPTSELKERSFTLTPQFVITVLTVVFVVAIVGYLVYQFYQLQKPPELAITNPKDGQALNEPQVTVEGKTVADAVLSVNGEAVKVAEDGSFEVLVSLESGKNLIVVKSKDSSEIGKEAIVKIQVIYTEPVAEEEGGEETADEKKKKEEEEENAKVDKMEIVLEIGAENAWVELTVDDTREIANILTAGEKQEFVAHESMLLLTGKISSTTLTVNGKKQGFTGQTGVGRLECKLNESVEDGFVCELPE